MLVELRVAEQRLRAVWEVVDGASVTLVRPVRMCRAGLQIRVHGFKIPSPLGRLAQWERASLTRKRSLVQIQYRPRRRP
jgi:hypothetical protein